MSCVPYQQLERLRIRIEAELEERGEAGELSRESAVKDLYRFYYRDRKRHSEYISLKKALALRFERPPVHR